MKQKDILYISVSIFILIFAWVVFSVMHNFMSTTISTPTEQKISPISPNFDLKAIEAIKKREIVEPLYELGGAVEPSPVIVQENEQSSAQNLSVDNSTSGNNTTFPTAESFSSTDAAQIFLEGFR